MPTATLAGSATDDGLPNPPGALTYKWTKVSGPGDVTFVDDTDPASGAEFSEAGVYVLRLTVSDGALNGIAEVTITVSAFVPVPPNTGLRKSMERVGGMSRYHWYRTDDFQTRAIEGGPTWVRHDVAVDDTEIIYSYVVNPFSAGYLADTGEVNAFVATGEAILKVIDLFGVTVSRMTLHTFPVALSAATHWRTIQASFGAYFEANNPWLVCISYYGDTVGHTGTWAARSLDGGITWSSEVQVSAHYDTALSVAAPIAVYTSPRTPGFCMCVAYLTTASPATSDIYISYDWGATWTPATAIVEDPAEPWPIVDPPGGGGGGGGLVSYSQSTSGTVTDDPEFSIFAPVGVKQMIVQVVWSSYVNKDGGFSSAAGGPGASAAGLASIHLEGESGYGNAGYNEVNGGSKTYRVETPGADGDDGITLSFFTGVNSVGGRFISMTGVLTAYVSSMTLDDDTVYISPIIPLIGTEHGQGGSMHVAWLDEAEARVFVGGVNRTANRLLTLKSIVGGSAINVSPNDGTRDLGAYFGPFGIRTYDPAPGPALLGARGNDTSTGATDDVVGLYISQVDGGGSWQELLAPVDESNVHMGIQAAFSGTDPAVLFAWGGWTDGALAAIYYSRDSGQTMDSRQGNLAALEDAAFGDHIAFIGIAGGPADDEPAPPEGDGSWYGNPAYYYGDMKAYVLWDGTDVLRTDDIQDLSPTWERIDTGISGTIQNGRYIHIDEDTIGMWLMTTTGIFWCADILAVTPSWSNVLPIATVVAADAVPATGTVMFQCMDAADMQPGFLCVATGPVDEDSTYLHAYFWITDDFGATWDQVDMNSFTFTSDSATRCYSYAGRFGMSIFRKEPNTIWCLRNTARTGSSTGRTAVFKSEDMGQTWTKGHEFANWSANQNKGSLLAPFPYLDDPGYIVRAAGSTGVIRMYVTEDGFATVTEVAAPIGYDAGFGNSNVVQRVSKRVFTREHIMATLLVESSSGGDLHESFDMGATWTMIEGLSNNHTNPNPWPLDVYQWVLIENAGGGGANTVRLTMDDFANLDDRTGNLMAVISGGTWANGLGNGFALPRVGTNA